MMILMIDVAIFLFFLYKVFTSTGWIEIAFNIFFLTLSAVAILYELKKNEKLQK